MKRDRQLVLLLLEKYEAMEPSTYEEVPTIEGYSSDQVRFHIRLCYQADFLFAPRETSLTELTWSGHDYLDRGGRSPKGL